MAVIYDLNYGAKVIIEEEEVMIAPGSLPLKKGDKIKILEIDGMYANARKLDTNEYCYPAAWTEVEVIPK